MTTTQPSLADASRAVPELRPVSTLRALSPMLLRVGLLALAFGAVVLGGRALGSSEPRSLIFLNATIILVDLVCIAVVAWLARAEGGLRTVIDFRPVDIAWGLLATVILFVAFFATQFLANLIVYAGPPPTRAMDVRVPLWLGILGVTVMPVTIAVAEELVYRGYGQTRLTAATGDRWVAWVVTAVLFSAQHFFLTGFDLRAQAARFIALVLCGLVFGALAWWWKRITPLVIGHWALDVLGLGLPLLMAGLAR